MFYLMSLTKKGSNFMNIVVQDCKGEEGGHWRGKRADIRGGRGQGWKMGGGDIRWARGG